MFESSNRFGRGTRWVLCWPSQPGLSSRGTMGASSTRTLVIGGQRSNTPHPGSILPSSKPSAVLRRDAITHAWYTLKCGGKYVEGRQMAAGTGEKIRVLRSSLAQFLLLYFICQCVTVLVCRSLYRLHYTGYWCLFLSLAYF